MITIAELSALTQHIDALDLECDGASRLVHSALIRARVSHQVFVGHVENQRGITQIPLHFWIRVANYTIDYRCRMWAGEQAPHGVFLPEDYPAYVYIGKPTIFSLKSCMLLERIMRGEYETII